MSDYERESPRELHTFVDAKHLDTLISPLRQSTPSVVRALAGLVIFLILTSAALLWFVPWIQTAAGSGQIVALDPGDRVQSISALVDGRIKKWHVQDGSIVLAGDPIVEIGDIDPNLVPRLQAERAAIAAQLEAASIATDTARLDYERQERLYKEGLSARKDFEAAKIKFEETRAREAAARASLSKSDIGVARQSSQVVYAPEDGRILHIVAGSTATIVNAGDPIATFSPEHIERAVEIFVSGLDAPLVQPGLNARIMFEGWPAVQFSGWPKTAIGTFAGVVSVVDPAASAGGFFRVLITEHPDEPWPGDRYLRVGGKAKAWIQLTSVRLGFELWRQLNRFPPQPVGPGT